MRPLVAILGRPNVGKSTFFNRLIGRRQALVDEMSGVTRDRIYGEAEWAGHVFRLVDTGGIDCAHSSLSEAIRAQSLQAVAEANLLLCLFDARDGLTPLDEEIIAILRRADRRVIYVVNKVDTERQMDTLAEFTKLGKKQVYPISAEHGRRLDDLLDAIVETLCRRSPLSAGSMVEVSPRLHGGVARRRDTVQDIADGSLRVAIIGRPNVGKSSLVNRLAGAPRVVAHELPGTTRDAIDIAVRHGEHAYIFVDTAGIRRRARTEERVEKFSVIKALQTMERADIVVLLADATEGLTHQDRQLAARIVDAFRPLLIVMNKWDLIPKRKAEALLESARFSLRELQRVPMLAISVLTGSGCQRLFPAIQVLAKARISRLKTAALNRVLGELQERHHLPSYRSQPLRLYYATQVGVRPPSFIIFANYPTAIPTSYRRYLLKAFEEALGAPGLPIRLTFRKRS